MSCLGFNCRGLGNPSLVSSLKELVRREAPSILFLCETKLSGSEMATVINKFSLYEGVAVDSRGRVGGLALLWKKSLKLELKYITWIL